MRHNILIFICIILGLLFLHFGGELFVFYRIPLVSKNTVASIKVYPSENIQSVAAELSQQHIISNPRFFTRMFTLMNHRLRFGEYEIKYPITASRLLKNMTRGVGLMKHRLMIVEGWTFQDIQTALARDTNLKQTLFNQTDESIMKSL